jgi:hypothetical protein
MSSDEVEEKDLGGRPPEGIKSGQHQNAFGWDPTGRKQIRQDFDPENQKTAFQPTDSGTKRKTFAAEGHSILKHIKAKNNKAKIISETLNTKETDVDSGTMLDEDNIL